MQASVYRPPWNGVGAFLERSIFLPAGSYEFGYWMQLGITDFLYFSSGSAYFHVFLDGVVIQTQTLNINTGGIWISGSLGATKLGPWAERTTTFEVAASGNHDLRFQTFATDAVVGYSLLDDVRITDLNPVSPVPEPETYAMLLAGLVILGWYARRRKLKLAA